MQQSCEQRHCMCLRGGRAIGGEMRPQTFKRKVNIR
jgi:hypothetical protein